MHAREFLGRSPNPEVRKRGRKRFVREDRECSRRASDQLRWPECRAAQARHAAAPERRQTLRHAAFCAAHLSLSGASSQDTTSGTSSQSGRRRARRWPSATSAVPAAHDAKTRALAPVQRDCAARSPGRLAGKPHTSAARPWLHQARRRAASCCLPRLLRQRCRAAAWRCVRGARRVAPLGRCACSGPLPAWRAPPRRAAALAPPALRWT